MTVSQTTTPEHHRRRWVRARSAALTVLLTAAGAAGCGDDGPDEGAQPSITTTTRPQPTTTRPRPTTTTSPLTTAPPQVVGIGVSTTDALAYFTEPLRGYIFESGDPVDGEPQQVGRSPDGRRIVQVIGEPHVLSVSIILVSDGSALPYQDLHALALIRRFAPGAESFWDANNPRTYRDHADYAAEFTAEQVYGARKLSMDFNDTIGTYAITITTP